MVLLGDKAQVEAQKTFLTHPIELQRDMGMWNLVSVHLETVLVSVQGIWVVCAKRTIGSEIISDTLDGTPWWQGSSENSF